MRDLCEAAVDAAVGAGATYADARIVVRRDQRVSTRNRKVDDVTDTETAGIGVRVLVGGAWGFASTRDLGAARDTALSAVAFASASPGRHDRTLAPVEAATGTWRGPVEIDPLTVSVDDKVAHLLRAEEAMRHESVTVTEAVTFARRQQKWFASSEGSALEQESYECGAGIDATAVGEGGHQIRSYPSQHGGTTALGGWEVVLGLDLEAAAPRIAEQAAALLRADPCPAMVTTVVIDSDQMQSQVHESVGHPTELDRVLGAEAAYAGTSFLKRSDEGSLRYGSPLMHVTSDATTPGGLGTFGWDDEGVPARKQDIVREGVLVGWTDSRELGGGGSMRADGWSRMPLVRMTNLHLEPGSGSFEELLDGVEEGVYLETNRSWSIDDKRLNFQFGTQIAWEIVNGRLGRMLRDASYTGVTPQFWATLDAVAGPEEWRLGGLTNCGKGQPGQAAHVSHGASPCRFRDVRVGVTA
ncbi:MAG TPA: TldD/PmbA family protein [Gaiellaceae bacterium]